VNNEQYEPQSYIQRPVNPHVQRGTTNREKILFLIWLRSRYTILEFFTIAPVLTSIVTVCRRIAAIRRLYWT